MARPLFSIEGRLRWKKRAFGAVVLAFENSLGNIEE